MSYEAWGEPDDSPFEAAIEAGWIDPDDLSKAMSDVMAERDRQVSEEGWSIEHDDQHVKGELVAAAVCYVLGQCGRLTMGLLVDVVNRIWPFDVKWLAKGHDKRRSLVIAASLLVAEIERLDRASASTPKGDQP